MYQETTQYPTKRQQVANLKTIQKLAKLAEELAACAGHQGIIMSDVRLEAFKRNILNGSEQGRDLSYLSAVPMYAGLRKAPSYRRSALAVSHGNLQRVWIHPDYTPYL